VRAFFAVFGGATFFLFVPYGLLQIYRQQDSDLVFLHRRISLGLFFGSAFAPIVLSSFLTPRGRILAFQRSGIAMFAFAPFTMASFGRGHELETGENCCNAWVFEGRKKKLDFLEN